MMKASAKGEFSRIQRSQDVEEAVHAEYRAAKYGDSKEQVVESARGDATCLYAPTHLKAMPPICIPVGILGPITSLFGGIALSPSLQNHTSLEEEV
jgi:hypothetical protein